MLIPSSVRNRSLFVMFGLIVTLLASSCVGATQAAPSHSTSSNVPIDRFNAPGNVLISDQFNNRVVEVARDGHIVWAFGSGYSTLCNPGPGTIIGLNDAERLSGGLTLLAGLVSLPVHKVTRRGAMITALLSSTSRAKLSGNMVKPVFQVLVPIS